MRVPTDAVPSASPRLLRRYQIVILVAIVALIVILIAVQQIADIFTNYLWYRSEGADDIWRSMTWTKVEIGLFFTGLFFVACWTSLLIVDRVAPRALFMSPEQEIVRRYQTAVRRHRFGVRTVVSFLVALAVGSGTTAQWQNWLLFLHGGSFGVTDQQFGRNVGFYVFKLPFLSFLVDWTQTALIVLFIVCVAAYYLNGGLRFSGPSPRVDPRATSHLSVILAAMALLRAAAYFYVDRFELDLTPGGIFSGVQGAGYTAVHVRLPALDLLVIVALASFALFVYNVYARGWMLPAVAAGLWAFTALTLGVIFPAVVQWLQVTPSQSTVELKYISRNIAATRAAFGLTGVDQQSFKANSDATAGVVTKDYAASLNDIDLWDPTVASQTLQVLQRKAGYYTINGFALDRYPLTDGKTTQETPVVIGVREVSSANLNRTTWVNSHLVYTHGYGSVVATANDESSSPNFVSSNVPVQTSSKALALSQPDVYYGVGETGYVVADSAQPELNYQSGSTTVTSRYTGTGGIRVGGFWQKAAFALRFHDFNLLVSRLVTPNSRIMYNQDVSTLVQNVAPFLRVDTNPYPVIVSGHLDWIVDAYTTTSFYPYAQTADTSSLTYGSGLAGSYNYIRNSVKAVVDAYTGKVTLYAVDPSSGPTTDPILDAWEKVFPGMFHPLKSMGTTLLAHLRYPQDLLQVESAMFGKYHVQPAQASEFYYNELAWSVAQTSAGTGSPYDQPVYQLLQLPDQSTPTFNAYEALVPYSQGARAQNLTAFLVASCSSTSYGNLTAYEVSQAGAIVAGPAIANATMNADTTFSQQRTYLDQHGSTVVLGPILLVPIDDSLLYVRAFFVSASSNAKPALTYVVGVYGSKVVLAQTFTGTDGVLDQLFGQTAASIGSNLPTNLPENIKELVAEADALQVKASAALKAGNFALFGQYFDEMEADLTKANADLAQLKTPKTTSPLGSSTTGSTTTTTTVPSSSSTSVPASTTTSSVPALARTG